VCVARKKYSETFGLNARHTTCNPAKIVLWVDEMRSIVRASQASGLTASVSINTSAMLTVCDPPSGGAAHDAAENQRGESA